MKKGMGTHFYRDQRGIGHVVEIIIIAIIVLGIGGFIAWRVITSQSSGDTTNQNAQNAIANASCTYDDKDLCKFFTAWKTIPEVKVTATSTLDGVTTTSTYESTSDGKRYHMTTTVNGAAYEVISIENTLYTKDQGDGSWWKQTLEPSKTTEYKPDEYTYDFEEPTNEQEAHQPQYKALGKEACGTLQCFKYQVIDQSSPGTVQYLWFDDKEYQLRRMRTEGDGTIGDQSFSYEKVAINEPSPVKDLPAGHYIVPGSSTPVSFPGM